MRIPALDLVRFCAAISVVLYHYISRPESNAFPLLRNITDYGYLGVPLFFIISGYVIALSANNRSALQFAISRFVRLYPALWIGVLFTAAVLFAFSGKQYSATQILANFTLLNEYLGFEDIDGVYWTLKAELKFYACVFLLLAFGVFKKYKIWLSLWLGITVTHAIFAQPFFMGWFISPGYSSFFIAGIAFFLIQNNGKEKFSQSIIFLSLIVSSFRAYSDSAHFMVNPSMVEKYVSVAIVWCFFGFMYLLTTGKINFEERRVFINIGALTYPLYLIHNMAGKAIIDHYSSAVSEEVMIIVVVILMIFLSWVIHRAFEQPFSTILKKRLLPLANRKESSIGLPLRTL